MLLDSVKYVRRGLGSKDLRLGLCVLKAFKVRLKSLESTPFVGRCVFWNLNVCLQELNSIKQRTYEVQDPRFGTLLY